MLTPKQQGIAEFFADDTSGFGNGHVFYMITGINEKEKGNILTYLKYLYDMEDYCFCSLEIKGNMMSFHSHEKYHSDLQEELSRQFSKATVYWTDCWDDEGTLIVMRGGEEIDPKEACRVTLNECEVSDADPECFDVTATVEDKKSMHTFEIGGGCVSADQKDMILKLVA